MRERERQSEVKGKRMEEGMENREMDGESGK